MKDLLRCPWCLSSDLMIAYHDKEWGTPLHDETRLFEALIIDGFQAGLSWSTILNKRENFRKAFHNFDAAKIAKYTDKDKKRLLSDAGIIRNRSKVNSAITNAEAFLIIQKGFGSFDKYLWSFVNGKPVVNNFKVDKKVPASTPLSDKISKDLKNRGFKFVGTTIIYAFLQGVGIVNDHIASCFRHNELSGKK